MRACMTVRNSMAYETRPTHRRTCTRTVRIAPQRPRRISGREACAPVPTWEPQPSAIGSKTVCEPPEQQGAGSRRTHVRGSAKLSGTSDRADGRHRAGKAKIGLQNLAYNIRRLVRLERMAAA